MEPMIPSRMELTHPIEPGSGANPTCDAPGQETQRGQLIMQISMLESSQAINLIRSTESLAYSKSDAQERGCRSSVRRRIAPDVEPRRGGRRSRLLGMSGVGRAADAQDRDG